MNSSEPNPPKSSSSSTAGGPGPNRPSRGRRSQQPPQSTDRVTSESNGQINQPDTSIPANGPGSRRRNGGGGPPSRGAPAGGGGSRGKKRQPSHANSGPVAGTAAPVVPRILMRPERIARANDETVPVPIVLARRPVASPPPPPPAPPQHPPPVRTQAPAESLTIADIPAYKHIADQPRSSRLMLLSPAGKLLDSVVRKHLGPLDCRLCIGVLGRPSTGKSLVLSRLAQSTDATEIFPLAMENKIGTLGVDFWVTPARIILIDTPPVLSLVPSDVRLRLAGPGALGLVRTRDLQLATLLMQVCDVLLVFVDCAKGPGLDRGLVKLLVEARTLSQALPRLDAPHLPSDSGDQRHKCKLHIVLNAGASHSVGDSELGDVARSYEKATGITVCDVSLIPSQSPLPVRSPTPVAQGVGVPRFLQVAESWAATPVLPLYPPPLDMVTAAKSRGSLERRSLLCLPLVGNSPGSFELAIGELRARLLAPVSPLGWDERPQGIWMNTCLRAWDSIRRSFQLQNLASAFEQENGVVSPALLSRSGRPK
ncbi:hypothetical protein GGH94_002891 [Coemansia aciculifera]|uniref:G domain-containing protein n=1 Tax=Coemansia aciculifera TaxID=417176 RepID=A0A9W8M5K6_9FUNG|nr:hypothetical protein GGH94_002891 [Coemansia aciculifera]KAJ2869582.1 hypothetical protein GGH93_006114 [Coemansia aciculifera]